MPLIRRLLSCAALSLAAAVLPLVTSAAPALASHSQVALFEDDGHLATDPQGTMDTVRRLGAQEMRVYVEWSFAAPNSGSFTRPAGFDPASPSGYNWARYDNIVHAALTDHIKLDFVLSGGAPKWAISKGYPSGGDYIHYAWKPNAALWGDFVHAAVAKYGKYVHTWEIYNEPNFGEDLAPQLSSGKYDTGASQYRTLVDAAWQALTQLHHTHDTITIGQITARGQSGHGLPGIYGQTKPLIFMRDLYCVGTNLKPLTGSAAKYAGCPTNASGRARFAASHPGLFKMTGVGIHPYPVGLAPDRDSSRDPNFVTFNAIPRLEHTLDGIARTYHAHSGTGLYNTEYGYVTSPPHKRGGYASPAQAAVYINQAEYLSWRDPRIRTSMQYLLVDPATNGPSQFFSGLVFNDGQPKATFGAYRMPLYLPSSAVRKGTAAEVWGAARPYATLGGGRVSIQWRRSSGASWSTLATASPARGTGYFDLKVKFPASGEVQTTWNEAGVGAVVSRTASITVR